MEIEHTITLTDSEIKILRNALKTFEGETGCYDLTESIWEKLPYF